MTSEEMKRSGQKPNQDPVKLNYIKKGSKKPTMNKRVWITVLWESVHFKCITMLKMCILKFGFK